MGFQIKQATRELIWTKIALMSPSGGGKTFSSLRLATGMLNELKKIGREQNGKILMGNTEQKRGYYYANEFNYDIVDINAPHNPESYVEFVEFAVENNYPILIIDSTSHEWEGRGGCLELHQQAGGTFQSWAKVTPRHDRFLVSLADSPIHIIATMRGKDQYEIEKGENNKTSVKKLGVGAKQREGFEYEFTATFTIDQKTNMAEPQKDNTHLFEHETSILTEKHGQKIIQWANSGEGYTAPLRSSKSEAEVAGELKSQIQSMYKEATGEVKKKFEELFKEFDPSGNPNKVKDPEKQRELITKMKEAQGA
jgi:hypothetical protein